MDAMGMAAPDLMTLSMLVSTPDRPLFSPQQRRRIWGGRLGEELAGLEAHLGACPPCLHARLQAWSAAGAAPAHHPQAPSSAVHLWPHTGNSAVCVAPAILAPLPADMCLLCACLASPLRCRRVLLRLV